MKYDDGSYFYGWGDDCVVTLAEHLRSQPRAIVYAHNGGRFDFLFMAAHLEPECIVIDGRIAKCRIGEVELRDSFLILPKSLSEIGVKIGIDYRIFARNQRNLHKKKILKYLAQDCATLLDQVLVFRMRFGNAFSVASAATQLLNKIHKAETGRKIARLTMRQDGYFRRYFFGGRNEVFEAGVIADDWKMFDVRSMFAAVMRDFSHPTGTEYLLCDDLTERTDFVEFSGHSCGDLPLRAPDGSVNFPVGRHLFRVTGWELRHALERGTVQIERIFSAVEFTRRENFADFVNIVGDMRMKAIAEKRFDDAGNLKAALVSAYGKQAFNVEKMHEWQVLAPLHQIDEDMMEEMKSGGWHPNVTGELASFWSRPAPLVKKISAIRHVALAASITGAARMRLAEALSLSDRPVYTDTDGIICRSLDLPQADEIGGWRQIDRGTEVAIYAKKGYCLWDEFGPRKWASKGADLKPEDIRRLAEGAVIKWASSKPNFSVNSMGDYVRREFRRTA